MTFILSDVENDVNGSLIHYVTLVLILCLKEVEYDLHKSLPICANGKTPILKITVDKCAF